MKNESRSSTSTFTFILWLQILLWPVIVLLNPKAKFQALLVQQETAGLLAKFSHDVVTAYESVPLYIPAMALSG